MPTFEYSTVAGNATIEAPDRAAALRQLIGRGVAPSGIHEVRGRAAQKAAAADAAAGPLKLDAPGTGATPATNVFGGRASVSLQDTASFIRELATALSAGLPLMSALKTLARSGRSAAQQTMLRHLIDRVEQGSSLAEACKSYGKPFDALLINLIKAGEVSGKLPEVLHQAADLLEKSLAMRRSIVSATIYPAMLAVLILSAVVIATTYIVPRILKTLESNKVQLPWTTQIIKTFADFMGSYWWVVIGVIILGVLAFARARANPVSRYAMDRFVLKAPLMGPMLTEAAVARFTRTLGTLVQAGLPVLGALRLTAATITNTAMKKAVLEVCEKVAGGKTIADPLEKTGYFPPLLVQIVSLGERSGKLPELLTNAANSLEERTEIRVKVFTEALRPLLVIVMALIAAFVIVSILSALLALQDSLGGS
ncbi:MAG: type II secretion system F family protein [Phycisphaerales bacterium]|nr:type II secretion system F family protein [Phycisphaerales bacterium]